MSMFSARGDIARQKKKTTHPRLALLPVLPGQLPVTMAVD